MLTSFAESKQAAMLHRLDYWWWFLKISVQVTEAFRAQT